MATLTKGDESVQTLEKFRAAWAKAIEWGLAERPALSASKARLEVLEEKSKEDPEKAAREAAAKAESEAALVRLKQEEAAKEAAAAEVSSFMLKCLSLQLQLVTFFLSPPKSILPTNFAM